MSASTERITALLEPVVSATGLVLDDLVVTPAGKRRVLRVVVDLPAETTGGIPLDSVAQASRAVSEALDASEVMGAQPYVLEVTSPGADRPLTEQRHWSRARGRLVTAPLTGGGEVSGRLTRADADGVTLDVDGRDVVHTWAEVGTGRIELEFNRPDGMPDLQDEGPDDAEPDDAEPDDAEPDVEHA